jgi:hypothetical protein
MDTRDARLLEIRRLDLERIVAKLGAPDPTIARVWTRMEAQRAVVLYKNFLTLQAMHAGARPLPLQPSAAVDEVWHQHILDTRGYATDCHRIFEAFFHHDPWSTREERVTDDEKARREAVNRLLPLIEFGQGLE